MVDGELTIGDVGFWQSNGYHVHHGILSFVASIAEVDGNLMGMGQS